jgi:hypothetical protein
MANQLSAYELADEMDEIVEKLMPLHYIKESANMLRQQADRIAELEELLKIDGDEIKILQSLLKEKQSKPVAWWTGRYEDEGEDFMFPNTRQAHIDHPKSCTHKFFPIPLYTTPQTKPLSDEEIVYLAKRFEGVWDGAVDYKRFARAIEAKVRGEK